MGKVGGGECRHTVPLVNETEGMLECVTGWKGDAEERDSEQIRGRGWKGGERGELEVESTEIVDVETGELPPTYHHHHHYHRPKQLAREKERVYVRSGGSAYARSAHALIGVEIDIENLPIGVPAEKR